MTRDSLVVPVVLNPDEVADLVGLSVWTIRRVIRTGELPAVRLGRR
jgi:excisionase family DNA binding protein